MGLCNWNENPAKEGNCFFEGTSEFSDSEGDIRNRPMK